MDTHFVCHTCHSKKPIAKSGGIGYGIYNNNKICYSCVAIEDIKYMNDNGKTILYYDDKGVSNWPGSLRFSLFGRPKQGKHNIAGKRIDVWFKGPSNDLWWGVQYGDNTQLIHCKRIKE